MALEGGVLIYECIKNLKKSGRSKMFVQALSDIAINHIYKGQDNE